MCLINIGNNPLLCSAISHVTTIQILPTLSEEDRLSMAAVKCTSESLLTL